MSPTADAAGAAVPIGAAAAEELLGDGEAIILTVKPSPWFALVISWPVLVLAALVAGGVALAEEMLAPYIHAHYIYSACIGVVCFRGVLACSQWGGKLYILTSRRVLSMSGLSKVVIDECPLSRIKGTQLSATTRERILGLGSLLFEATSGKIMETGWPCLANPAEVQEAVDRAIAHCR